MLRNFAKYEIPWKKSDIQKYKGPSLKFGVNVFGRLWWEVVHMGILILMMENFPWPSEIQYIGMYLKILYFSLCLFKL